MSFLSARDLRTIQKFLVIAITEIKTRNPEVKIPQICEGIEAELSNLKSLGSKYLNDANMEDPDEIKAKKRGV